MTVADRRASDDRADREAASTAPAAASLPPAGSSSPSGARHSASSGSAGSTSTASAGGSSASTRWWQAAGVPSVQAPAVVAGLLAALLVVYLVLPVIALAWTTPPGALPGVFDPVVVRAAVTSVTTATASTLVALVAGVPLAYALARGTFPGRSLLLAVVVFPLVLPPVVGGMLVLTVVGPGSPLGAAAAALGVPLTQSAAGVVLAQTFVAAPFTVVTAKAAFESVDPRLEDAARTLGRGPVSTVRSVTLPLARRGIVAGLTLTFARSIGEFGATTMLAYHPRTMPVQIWVSYLSTGLDGAFPVALVLLATSATALGAVWLLGRTPWS